MKGHVYGLQNDFRVWLLIYNFFFLQCAKKMLTAREIKMNSGRGLNGLR